MKSLFFMAQTGGSGSGSVGIAGQQGFGVGPYPGDAADYEALGLQPMDGCDDPASDNYGNYIHTNGSIVCCVPWHLIRSGHDTAPSYSRDGANALEVIDYDETLEGKDGWFLPRAFIDGGEIKKAYFIDKYLNSKSADGKQAVSVKNGDPISLTTNTSYNNSNTLPNCVGQLRDAITLGKARGTGWSCISMAIWADLSMLSLAHGQAAASADFCAWYDANHQTNFPKGNNVSDSLKDTNDSTITFTATAYSAAYSKAGSGVPFAKTTHNGQNCGICDVNGNKYQMVIGVSWVNGHNAPLKESYKIAEITYENITTTAMYEDPGEASGGNKWGNGANGVFFTETTGPKKALNGMYAKSTGQSSTGTALFGNDYDVSVGSPSYAPFVGGNVGDGAGAGVFYRAYNGGGGWTNYYDGYGCRAAGYAP